MSKSVIKVLPLETQWTTLDPFLFCAHHLDLYPASDGALAPTSNLVDREIGNDFSGLDGWNMYHGSKVPGFPQHPHRGFETITYVRKGWCDHSDSLGFKARFGEGDVQWLTAGKGIVHSEMFPLLKPDEPNTLHLFQIWLNLPAAKKLVDPYFSMLWENEIPKIEIPGVSITVIAGEVDGTKAASAPPDSWAANSENNVGIWHIKLEAGSSWDIPKAKDVNRVLYIFDGTIELAGSTYSNHAIVVNADELLKISASENTELMLLQGKPINEPVAQYGPFVMNNKAELQNTILEYQKTQFGGWPWPKDDPTHGYEEKRFADQ